MEDSQKSDSISVDIGQGVINASLGFLFTLFALIATVVLLHIAGVSHGRGEIEDAFETVARFTVWSLLIFVFAVHRRWGWGGIACAMLPTAALVVSLSYGGPLFSKECWDMLPPICVGWLAVGVVDSVGRRNITSLYPFRTTSSGALEVNKRSSKGE